MATNSINPTNSQTNIKNSEIPAIVVNSDSALSSDYAALSKALADASHHAYCLTFFSNASRKAGSFVDFPQKYGFIPTLRGIDNEPVLLYRIVEEIETIVDPDDLLKRFSTLSYAQIVGALIFLRKMAQFNSRNIDVDEIEDSFNEADPSFQQMLEESMNNTELRYVYPTK